MPFDHRRIVSTFALLALSSIALWGWACDTTDPADTGGSDPDTDALRRDVLDSVANRAIAPTVVGLRTDAETLVDAMEVLAAAPQDPAALEAAQAAYLTAWRRWQHIEMMQIGPLALPDKPAGEGLRDEAYSWPTVSACTVDRRVADESFENGDFILQQLVFAYGFDALEYLLFSRETDHVCAANIGLDPTWDALSFEEIEDRRARYGLVLAEHIAGVAVQLDEDWSGGRYGDLLANPGEGDSPYANVDAAIDDVFRAMFYIDLQTKDAKLGAPLGLTDGCASVPCVDLLEAPHSRDAAEAIASNLEALKVLVQGGTEPETDTGFDDLLVHAGQPEVADDLLTKIDAAIADARALSESLHTVFVTDPARAEQLHASIREVTDILKGPFSMALRLQIPAEGAGDND